MRNVLTMLGTGLVKKERRVLKLSSKKEKEGRMRRKKVSVELFLRDILGTHLIEKKF